MSIKEIQLWCNGSQKELPGQSGIRGTGCELVCGLGSGLNVSLFRLSTVLTSWSDTDLKGSEHSMLFMILSPIFVRSFGPMMLTWSWRLGLPSCCSMVYRILVKSLLLLRVNFWKYFWIRLMEVYRPLPGDAAFISLLFLQLAERCFKATSHLFWIGCALTVQVQRKEIIFLVWGQGHLHRSKGNEDMVEERVALWRMPVNGVMSSILLVWGRVSLPRYPSPSI
jgi:hypothetical protein